MSTSQFWPGQQPPAQPAWTAPSPQPAQSSAVDPWQLSFAGLLRSEWLKLASMTSTWVLVGISFAMGLYTTATSAQAGLYFIDMFNQGLGTDYGIQNLSSAMWGAPIYSGVLLALLGVLSITNEYSSGMIRTTLTITPSRWPALAAKAIVVTAFAFISSAVAEFLGALLALPGLDGTVNFDLFQASGLRVWLGSCAVLALMAMLGLGLGTLIRSTAVAIVAYFGVMLILPLLFLFGLAAAQNSSGTVGWMLLHLPALAPFGIFTPIFDELGQEVGVPITTSGAVAATLFWTLMPLGFGFLSFMKRDA